MPRFLRLFQVIVVAIAGNNDLCSTTTSPSSLFAKAQATLDDACPLVTLLPFTTTARGPVSDSDPSTTTSEDDNGRRAWFYTAVVELARQHFNTRNPIVVSQLADLQDCNVTIPAPTLIDTENNSHETSRNLFQAYREQQSSEDDPAFCAAIGPLNDDGIMAASSVVTLAMDLPHFVFTLANKKSAKEPHFMGIGGHPDRFNLELNSYLQRIQRDHVVVYYDPVPHSSALANALSSTGSANNLTVMLVQLFATPGSGNERPDDSQEDPQEEEEESLGLPPRYNEGSTLRGDLERIQASGIRTVLFTFPATTMLEMIPMMGQIGMLSEEYLFIWQPAETSVDVEHFGKAWGHHAPNSAVDRFLQGALILAPVDGFRLRSDDMFVQSFREQPISFITNVNNLVRTSLPESSEVFQADADIFQKGNGISDTSFMEDFSSYLYDTVMAVGMGSCLAQLPPRPNGERPPPPGQSDAPPPRLPPRPENQGGGPAPQDETDSTDRYPLLEAIKSLTFEGASGSVGFLPNNGHRADFHLGAYNVVGDYIPQTDGTDLVEYSLRLTAVTMQDSWEDIPDAPFIYQKGKLNPPEFSIIVSDTNYLPSNVRAVGFVLLFLAWAMALLLALGVFILRKDSAVRIAQPIFLGSLCLGSVLQATSILTLSFDEGNGWDQGQLDIACQLTPWFFFVGQVFTFSALFTKIWRLDLVLQFRRGVQVKLLQVLGPLLALMVATVAILTAWTVIDPWLWTRTVVNEIPLETYGRCESDNMWNFFGPLVTFLIVTEGMSIYFALKTSDVPAQLRETSSVFYSIFMNLQAWLVGLPILVVIGDSSVEASYFGRISLIFILSVSTILIVVGPRVIWAIRLRLNPDLHRNRDRVRISGLISTDSAAGKTSSPSSRSYHPGLNPSVPPSPTTPVRSSSSIPCPQCRQRFLNKSAELPLLDSDTRVSGQSSGTGSIPSGGAAKLSSSGTTESVPSSNVESDDERLSISDQDNSGRSESEVDDIDTAANNV